MCSSMKGLEIAPVDELIFVDSPGRGKRRLGQCEEGLLSFHNSALDMALHAVEAETEPVDARLIARGTFARPSENILNTSNRQSV